MFTSPTPDSGRPRPRDYRQATPADIGQAAPVGAVARPASETLGGCLPSQPRQATLSLGEYKKNALSALTKGLLTMFPGAEHSVTGRIFGDSLNGGSLCSFHAIVSVVEQASFLGLPLPWKRNVGILSVSYGTSCSARCGLQVGSLHFAITRKNLAGLIQEIDTSIRRELANSEVGGFIPYASWDCEFRKKVRLPLWGK